MTYFQVSFVHKTAAEDGNFAEESALHGKCNKWWNPETSPKVMFLINFSEILIKIEKKN